MPFEPAVALASFGCRFGWRGCGGVFSMRLITASARRAVSSGVKLSFSPTGDFCGCELGIGFLLSLPIKRAPDLNFWRVQGQARTNVWRL